MKGYGMRGMCLLRRGTDASGKGVVHLLDSVCKSHRLTLGSSYGAELLAASHGYDDAYPTIIATIEMRDGVLPAGMLKKIGNMGGVPLKVILTVDAESVFKSIASRDLQTPAAKTLLGHVCWLREVLQLGMIESIQWCDTRDMAADGHTKGVIDRKALLDHMKG
eukprot:9238092-Karenia_brevis.AAC.1